MALLRVAQLLLPLLVGLAGFEVEQQITLIYLLICTALLQVEEPLLAGQFPEDFLWGAATAAYQVITVVG